MSAAAFAEQADQPRCGSQPQEMERDEVAKRHRLMLLWNGVKFMLLHDAMGEIGLRRRRVRDERWINPILPVTTTFCSIS